MLKFDIVDCAHLIIPKLQVVGEWTKVPDRDMSLMEEECAKKGLKVRLRNAEPYREFQNVEDNDR